MPTLGPQRRRREAEGYLLVGVTGAGSEVSPLSARSTAAAAALSRLAASPEHRRKLGDRSRELVAGWGYEPSVEAFVMAIRAAARR